MAEDEEVSHLSVLNRIVRELVTMRQLMSEISNQLRNAEAEVPEKMRRFTNYMHDLHDIRYMYEELGHSVPQHQLREMERCDDRFRQLIKELNIDGGAFERVRREMASDPENRWDHTRLLYPPKPEESSE